MDSAKYVHRLQTALSSQGQDEPAQVSIDTLYGFERDALLAIIHFRRQYNASLPPNRVPPEILGAVFESLRTEQPPNTGRLTEPLYDYTDVLSVLRVCRKWYDIAVTRATLWTFIDLAHDGNASLKLKRSRSAPLRIRFSLDMYASSVLVELLRNHGSRVRELHIWAQDQSSLNKLPARLNVLADRLERLALVGIQRPRGIATRSLLLGMTPVLRALMVERMPWVPLNSFPSLTHLHLSRLPRFPIDIFLRLLQRMSTLHLLHIDECDIDITGFDGGITPAVSLPRLRHFSLGHISFDPVPQILSHLDLPSNVMFRLYSLRYWQNDEEFDDYGDLVLPNPFVALNNFTRMELIVGDNWRKLVAESDHPDAGGFWVDFVLHHTPHGLGTEDWEDWLLHLPHTISLSSIETFEICTRLWGFLVPLAEQMPRVRSLTVKEYNRIPSRDRDSVMAAADGMISQLVYLLCSDAPVPFPKLEVISIDASCDLPFHEYLLAAAAHRDRIGLRLRALRIRVDPSKYTQEYITEKYTEVCKYVDEVEFIDREVANWTVSEVWRADHDYWELRPSEDPMRFMDYWYEPESESTPTT